MAYYDDEYERREARHTDSLRVATRILRDMRIEWPYHGRLDDTDLWELSRKLDLWKELIDDVQRTSAITRLNYNNFRKVLREIVRRVKDQWRELIPEHRILMRPFMRHYFTYMRKLLARKQGDMFMEL